MAFRDGTGAGNQSHWTRILTQCPNRKKLVLKGLSTFRKSASNISHSAITSQERSACVLHTVYSTACPHCIQFGAASAEFYALHAVVRPCIICILHCSSSMPQYRNASAVVNLQVVGKCCQTSCTTMGLYSHVALSHCAFSTSLVDFHTL